MNEIGIPTPVENGRVAVIDPEPANAAALSKTIEDASSVKALPIGLPTASAPQVGYPDPNPNPMLVVLAIVIFVVILSLKR